MVQLGAPETATDPVAHAKQDVAEEALVFPAGQFRHEGDCELGSYVPGMQELQKDEPATAYLPTPQIVQDREPALFVKVPAAHKLQADTPVMLELNEPGAQG